MTSIRRSDPSRPQSSIEPKTPPRRFAVLPDADHRQLQHHLEECGAAIQQSSPFLAHVLQHKIASSTPLCDEMPDDVVTGGSRVIYSIAGGPAQTGLLVHRARTGSGSGVIPVSSLLGATLIGMQVGQRAPLLCEDGTIVALSVLGLEPPA